MLIREPHVQALAENLKAYIKRVMQERSGLKSPASRSEILQVVDGQEGSDNQAAISAADSTKDPANAHEAESERQLELSLVLACHDESPHFRDNLQEIIRVLDAAELTYEIILIDDASTDGTAEQIRSYVSNHSSGNVRAFFNEIHRGRGAVLAEGLRKARAPYVGSINISLETLPQFIPAALDPLKRGAADMVFGDRKEVRPLEAPLRVAMSQGYRWLASLLLKTRSLDTASEFKFFRRDAILPVIDELNEPYPLWDTQLAALAHSKGLRAYSVPVAYFRPGSEDSVAVIFRDSWRSFASLLALAKRHRLGNQA